MAVLGIGVPAVGLGDLALDLAIGAVIFVVVCVVAAVLMALLQSVLPRTDTEAEALHRRELEAADVPLEGAPQVEEGEAERR